MLVRLCCATLVFWIAALSSYSSNWLRARDALGHRTGNVEQQEVRLVDQIGGRSQTVVHTRHGMATGSGPRVVIADSITGAVVAESAVLPGLVQSLATIGSVIIAVTGDGGAPVVVAMRLPDLSISGVRALPAGARDLALVSENEVLVGAGVGGLVRVPMVNGVLGIIEQVSASPVDLVAANADVLVWYSGASRAIVIRDLSTNGDLAVLPQTDYVSDILLDGKRLLVAGGLGVKVFDLGDKYLPVVVAELRDMGDGPVMALERDILFVADSVTGRVRAVRSIDSVSPSVVSETSVGAGTAALAVADDTLVGAMTSGGTWSVRFETDGPRITFGDATRVSRVGPVSAMDVARDIVVLVGERGLATLRRSETGHLDYGFTGTDGVMGDVALGGKTAYYIERRHEIGALHDFHVRALDVSQSEPLESEVFAEVGWADELAVSGRWLYVGSVFVGVLVLDVSQPLTITETGVIVDTSGQVDSLAAEGTIVLVGSRTGVDRLLILEASVERPALRVVSELPVEGRLEEVALSGPRGYVLSTDQTGSSRLMTVDLSDPGTPRVLNVITLVGTYKALTPTSMTGVVALAGVSTGGIGEVRLVESGRRTDVGRAVLPAGNDRDAFEVQSLDDTLIVRSDSGGVMSFVVADSSLVQAYIPTVRR